MSAEGKPAEARGHASRTFSIIGNTAAVLLGLAAAYPAVENLFQGENFDEGVSAYKASSYDGLEDVGQIFMSASYIAAIMALVLLSNFRSKIRNPVVIRSEPVTEVKRVGRPLQ